MLSISQSDIDARLLFDNPWWGPDAAAVPFRDLPKREYLAPFHDLATDRRIRRAISHLHYARWPTGEVDIVALNPSDQKPVWCVEVKWSDRPANDAKQLRHLLAFAQEHRLITRTPGQDAVLVTTKTIHQLKTIDDVPVAFVPTSLYAFVLGKNLLQRLHPH